MSLSARDLIQQRLNDQQLARSDLRDPAAIVSWFCAVQSQDYPAAAWALGLRADGLTQADVDRAFDAGTILRTHVMRPTWHFVLPADIRWMLTLTAPRIMASSASYFRTYELDDAVWARSRKMLEKALKKGPMTRSEISAAMAGIGVPCESLRLGLLLLRLELDQVVCSGPHRGKQLTYALFDERVPRAKALPRDEALAELTRCYFTSHGPATIRDYAWWSGLAMADVRRGIEIVRPALLRDTLDDHTYYAVTAVKAATRLASSAYLLPNYDEYLIAFKDRDPVVSPTHAERAAAEWRGPDTFRHHLVLDGRLAGSWRSTARTQDVLVEVVPYQPLTTANARALDAAAARYGRFLGVRAELAIMDAAKAARPAAPPRSAPSRSAPSRSAASRPAAAAKARVAMGAPATAPKTRAATSPSTKAANQRAAVAGPAKKATRSRS